MTPLRLTRPRLSKADSAERDLIGAAVLDGRVVDQFVKYVRVEDFGSPPAACVWVRLVKLRRDPFAADMVPSDWMAAVMMAAWDWGNESPVNTFGVTYVTECAAAGPTMHGALYAYRIMREEANRRRLAEALAVASDALKAQRPLSEVAAGLRAAVADIPPPEDGSFLASLHEPEDREPEPLPDAWAAHLTETQR